MLDFDDPPLLSYIHLTLHLYTTLVLKTIRRSHKAQDVECKDLYMEGPTK